MSGRDTRQLSMRSRCIFAAVSGGVLTALYPPFGFAVLGWIALTPLIVALDGVSARAGFALGWVTGTVISLGVTGYWMFHAARDYFQLSAVAAAGLTVAINQLFVSLYFGLFGLAVALAGRHRGRVFTIPALFVATEYARAHLLSGNPWDLLGHSQRALPIIQLCDLTGVFGLSFLLALAATDVAQMGRSRRPLVVTAAMLVIVLAYGEWRVASVTSQTTTAMQVAIVQANLPNTERGRPEFFAAHLTRYLALTRQAATPSPALIVWPENAIGFFPEENPQLLARIADQLRTAPAALLTGAPRAGNRPGVAAIYNSAYFLTADGIQGEYDKRVLLPFVERMPLRPDDGPYLPGTAATIFSVAGTRFGVLICYEAIYPELARELVSQGAQLLVNLSNDSWFEAGAGPQQHYDIARFRAVENRVSLVRVTNSGVSGVIDPAGREIDRLPTLSAASRSVAVPIGPVGSFYSRHGDVFADACVVLALATLLLRWLGLLPQ